jgi:mutator protein MutT
MKKGTDYIGVGCGALIINEKEEALLLKRGGATRNNAGYWSQPGGTVEFGETVDEAIIREIKEELNVDIELIRYLNYTDHIIPHEKQHWVAIAYLAKIVGGELKNMEPDKHEEIKWFPITEMPELLAATTVNSVEAYLAQKNMKES